MIVAAISHRIKFTVVISAYFLSVHPPRGSGLIRIKRRIRPDAEIGSRR
jgi:hypothetical protein